jgi:hypothetical protein
MRTFGNLFTFAEYEEIIFSFVDCLKLGSPLS